MRQAVDAIAEGNSSRLAGAQRFTLHFVGSDETECPTADATILLAIYGPFVEYLGRKCGTGCLTEVNIVFVGPNHPIAVHTRVDCQGVALTFDVHVTLYHHYAAAIDPFNGDEVRAPALVACFNAGLWGYSDWLPTLQLLNSAWLPAGAHFLITAYTFEEGEDDEDVLAEHCPLLSAVVPMQENPGKATLALRRESAKEERRYVDSHMWALMKKIGLKVKG